MFDKVSVREALALVGNTVISFIKEKSKFGPLKDCEGPQNVKKGPNDPWQFLLILTPACTQNSAVP